MLAGIALGVFCALAVFALLNATRQVFVSVHDVERQLDLPVLLAVPLRARRAARPCAAAPAPHGRAAELRGVSAVIEGEAVAAGLPPPLLLSTADASQLAFALQRRPGGHSVVQLVATRNGEGTSTIARDLCLVSACNGATTLLLAAEPAGPPRRIGHAASTACRVA